MAMLLVASFAACEGRPGHEAAAIRTPSEEVDPVDTLPYARVPSIDLRGAVIADDTVFAAPSLLQLVGDFLVVGNSGGDSAVIVLDRSSGKIVTAFGRNGGGPGEYRGLFAIQPALDSSSSAWLYDMPLRRLTQVRLDRSRGSVQAKTEHLIRLDTPGTTTSAAWLSDSTLVGLGFYEEGRLAFLANDGKTIGFRGGLPPNPNHVPAAVLQHAYQGSLAVRPDRTGIAVVTRHASYLEIYGDEGGLKSRNSGPFKFDPTFSVAKGALGPVMSSGDSLRFGYVALAVTQGRIYALFSGRTRLMYPGEANMGEYIHIFNWNGVFERSLHLTEPAIAIAVDSAEGTLYAASYLPRPVIIKYPLPEDRESH